MRVAFDLDDTLIPCGQRFPVAPPRYPWLAWILATERLRVGTVEAVGLLREAGHEVWVYTSSFRAALWIRLTFATYGLRLDGVVNQQRHDRALGRTSHHHIKHPPAFDIAVLLDDSQAVAAEARGYGVVLMQEGDDLIERTRAAIELGLTLDHR